MVNSKSKGSSFERDILHRLESLLETTELDDWYMVNRAPNYQPGEDLSIISKSSGKSILALECKCGKAPNIPKAMSQVEVTDAIPAVVSRKDRTGVLVTMRFEDWATLLLPPWLTRNCPATDQKWPWEGEDDES